MTDSLLTILLAGAVFALGCAMLIGHALASRVLAIAGTIVAGVVALFLLIQ